MNGIGRRFRVLALAAAYVVVLQALLLPLTVAATHARAADSMLCMNSVPADGEPAAPNQGCGCAAGCGMHCGTSAMGTPPDGFVFKIRLSAQAAAPSSPPEAAARTAGKQPQNPRAPPSA